jgi:hypothetical protein
LKEFGHAFDDVWTYLLGRWADVEGFDDED